ncbi:MAG: mechanosensitive ion channel family protein [Cyanobacteria bacterium P01_H01_bin.58]
MTWVFVLLQSPIAFGQDLSIFSNQAGTIPPEGVIRYGSIEAAWVRSPLDNEGLFQIAAPTVTDRKNLGPEDLPVEVRAQSIEALLQIEVERFRNNVFKRLANQLKVWNTGWSAPRSAEVIIATLNNRPVIQIKSSDRSRPLTIITITQTDIDFYSETPEVLSEEWQNILQGEIDHIEQISSLETAYRGLQHSFAIVVGMLGLTSILGSLHWLARWKRRTWQRQVVAEAEVDIEEVDVEDELSASLSDELLPSLNDNAPPDDAALSADAVSLSGLHLPHKLSGLLAERDRFLKLLKKEPPLAQRLNLLQFLQWLLVWLVVFVWYGGLIWLTYTVPMIRPWRNTLLSEPFRLLSIWFVVNLALRVNRTLAHQLTQVHQDISAKPSSEDQRKSLRTNTIGGAIRGFTSVLIILTGIILTLSTFGLSTQSVLAWGAVLGLAVSFGTQSLIKDVVNGCLILFEDQFAVGDVIAIGSMSGFVEEMSLRSTRLRDPEGQLITIPNGNIAEVRNLTRLWSRVDFTIEVAYDNDPDQVLRLLDEVAQDLHAQPEWQEKMPNPPEVLGIDQLSHSGILVRVWLKTAPLQQWMVGREYRLRVRRAFEAHNIMIGKPQWISHNTIFQPASIRDEFIPASPNSKPHQ